MVTVRVLLVELDKNEPLSCCGIWETKRYFWSNDKITQEIMESEKMYVRVVTLFSSVPDTLTCIKLCADMLY